MKYVACCSTLPGRLDTLQKSVQSICELPKISAIFVHYPKFSKRLKEPYPPIPKWASMDPRIEFVDCEDYGVATKFIPLLDRFPVSTNLGVVLFDDDKIYPKEYMEKLMTEFEHHGGRCGVGRHGSFCKTRPLLYASFNHTKKSLQFLNMSTAWGVIYPRYALPHTSKDALQDIEKWAPWGSRTNDDIMLASWSFVAHCPLHVVSSSKEEIQLWTKCNNQGNTSDSLSSNENNDLQQAKLVYALWKAGKYHSPKPEIIFYTLITVGLILLVFLIVFIIFIYW